MIDTWAFLEQAGLGPRGEEVRDALSRADTLHTVRDAVAETFTFIANRRGSKRAADWLDALLATPIEVLEPSLEQVTLFIQGSDRGGKLSFTDYAVGWAGRSLRTQEIATQDRGFRRLGLDPLFAPPG